MRSSYILAILVPVLLAAPVRGTTPESAHWRFSGDANQAPDSESLVSHGTIGRRGSLEAPPQSIRFSDELPQLFVYDPVVQRSQPSGATLAFEPTRNVPRYVTIPLQDIDGSFTIELFVRNGEELPGPAGRSLPLLTIESADESTAVGLVIYSAHGFNWWGGKLRHHEQERRMGRERYQGITHVRQPVWRHLALVYDAPARTVTTYLDYGPLESLSVSERLNLTNTTLHLGDVPNNRTDRRFVGQIADVRFTRALLPAWKFLRATPHDLRDVSFEPRPGRLPAGSGYVDVRLRYGAVGDGWHDDTHAFRRAFAELQDRVPIEYHTLYIPEGIYLISEPLCWTRFLIVQGAGRDQTILRLPDRTPGFGDAAQPNALLYAGWATWRERTGTGSAGNVIGNYLFDLTIDTGRGNPGVVGLSFHSNNHGSIENVSIRSGDGTGHRGLDFSPNWPGPTLIKNVCIDGFDAGIFARAAEYSLVFEDITLRNQRQIAILNDANILTIRRLTSLNRVPVIRTGGWGMVTLLDSELRAQQPMDVPAILNTDKGALYVRNVRTDGYAAAIRSDDREVPDGHVPEFLAGQPVSLFSAPATTLQLPIADAPCIPLGADDIRWANILDFAANPQADDWAPILEAAFTSGAEGVLFPANEGEGFRVRTTVEVPAHIRYLLGMRNSIGRHEDLQGPTLRIAQESEHPVIFERLGIAGTLEHAGKRVAVFRHNGPGIYQGREGSGNVFVESAEGLWRFARGQRAWARQLNPESHTESEVINEGADVWILGLKTEYATTMVVNRDGGSLEVLGGFLYPVTEVPPGMPMVLNQNARMSMIFSTSAYSEDHQIYFRDTQAGATRELRNQQIDSKGPRRQVHLYTTQP
jgi:hypothetical protein